MGSLGPSWITNHDHLPTNLVSHSCSIQFTRVGEGDHATCPFKYLKAIWFVDIYGPAAREGRWWSDLVEGVIMTVKFTGGISSLVVVFVCDDTNLWTMTTRRTRGSASEKTWNLSGESRVNSVCSGTGAQWGVREEVKGGGGNNCLVDMVYIKSTMRRNRFWKAKACSFLGALCTLCIMLKEKLSRKRIHEFKGIWSIYNDTIWFRIDDVIKMMWLKN